MSDITLLDDVFADVIEQPLTNRFATYGLNRNPFPGNEEEFYGFVIGQNAAKAEFKNRLEHFVRTRVVGAVLVEADHRVGKTNFLKFYHHRLKEMYDREVRRSPGTACLPLYTNVYEYDFFFLYQQIVQNIPDSAIDQAAKSVSTAPLGTIHSDTDMSRALNKFGQLYPVMNDQERLERTNLFKRWLRGGYRSLNKDERDILNVQENVTNSPVGPRFLRDFLEILNEREILSGFILFLDEFERLVGAGISRSQKDRYLNDIRNFMSDFQAGVFFCFAITPGAYQELQRLYPAIPPRLGTRLMLREISTEAEALEFAHSYIQWFRANSGVTKVPASGSFPPLLSDDQISNIYLRLQQRFTKNVPQGHLLAALRDDAEKVVSR